MTVQIHAVRRSLTFARATPEGGQTVEPGPAALLQRALGVDYGRRQIGLAVSTLGIAPRPLSGIRAGGLDVLMQMAQDVIDAAIRESAICNGTLLCISFFLPRMFI